MKNEQSYFKRTRNEVSYSNSFVFRSRCPICGSCPGKMTARRPNNNYEYKSSKEFLNNSLIDKVPKFKVVNRHQYKYMNVSFGSMNVRNFSKEKNKAERFEIWTRVMGCDCLRTWWKYQNCKDNKAVKSIKT